MKGITIVKQCVYLLKNYYYYFFKELFVKNNNKSSDFNYRENVNQRFVSSAIDTYLKIGNGSFD